MCTIVNAHRCCVASPYYEAWMFYVSWLCFPTLFLLGPEGAGHLSPAGSLIGHTFADLLSKNLWGIWSLLLREAVRNHHRKLWKEEQLRDAQGLSDFDIPKERRPDIHDAVNTFLANQMGGRAIPPATCTLNPKP